MQSVIQSEKRCFICGCESGLQSHHIYFGNPNRKNSETYGLKVWLCMEHHTGSSGVHQQRDLDLMLKEIAQRKFEETGTREDFVRIFGRNYLWRDEK